MAAKLEIEIDAITRGLTDGLKDATSKIQDFSNKAVAFGKVLSATVTLPITALGLASIKTFGDIEALKKGLIAVTGSAAKAEAEFTKLIEVAKLPGLGLEEAVRGSVSLQSAGFSADEARKALLAFGNALATVGKGKNELNFVILALTQLQNKTTGFGQDLRQLTEQLPQLRGALTEAFGTSDSEAIAELGVTGREVVDLLVTEFEKLPKVTGGVKNAFENFSDSTKISFARIGESINKAFDVEGLINRVSEFIDNISNSFSKLDSETQKTIIVFAGITASIGPLLLGIGGLIQALPLLAAGFAALTGPIGLSVTAVSVSATLIIANFDQIKINLALLGLEFIKVAKDILSAIDSVAGVIPGFKSVTTGALLALESVGKRLAKSFVESLSNKAVDSVEILEKSLNSAKKTGGQSFEDFSKAQDKVNKAFFESGSLIELEIFNLKNLKKIADDVAATYDKLGQSILKSISTPAIVDVGINLGEAPVIEIPDFDDSKATAFLSKLKDFNAQGSQILEQGISLAIGDLAFAIGDALATGSNILQAAGSSLLNSIAGILNQLGQLAIQTGVAIIGIKLALKTLNPAVAIVAGTALVALAGFVSSKARSLGNFGGGTGNGVGSTGQSQTFGGSGAFNNPNDFLSNVVFEIEGTRLVGVLQRTQDRYATG